MKLNKHAEVLSQLHQLVQKEMSKEAEKPEATGKPGKDTNYEQVDSKNDNTNKNQVGADKLSPQNHEQHKATDPSVPINHAKKADEEVKPEEKAAAVKPEEKAAEVKPEEKADAAKNEKSAAEIGKEILTMIDKFAETAKKAELSKQSEKPEASGKPGKDTNYEQVDPKNDTTNKNQVGADKLSPQNHEQHKATDPSVPINHAKKAEDDKPSAEDVNKVASYEFGKTLAEMILKSAVEQELALAKEAGRKDFEQLIALAAQELESDKTKTASEDVTEKHAEEAGAAAFQDIVKAAKHEQDIELIKKEAEDLKAKLAAVEAEKVRAVKEAEDKLAVKEAELRRQEEEKREIAKWSAMSDYITNNVFERLKTEIVKNNG
jgi:hypothetical protein